MAPRLRVLAGTSPSSMTPITHLVNTSTPHPVSSPLFEGEIVAHIKGLTDEQGRVRNSEYFGREERAGVTWSIVVRGRFLVPYSADDILFGNTFDRPLKLPWGTSAVLKFMHYIDPTLEHDLTSSTKPWALSPLISTMPHFTHTRVLPSSQGICSKKTSSFADSSIGDSTKELYLALTDETTSSSGSETGSLSSSRSASSSSSDVLPLPPSTGTASRSATTKHASSSSSSSSKSSGSSGSRIKDVVRKVKRRRSMSSVEAARARKEKELQSLEGATQRRSYFAQKARRKDVVFGPEDLITTDFCYGFINFAPSLSLQLPGGLSFDLMKYWDGQPVRFVCCERVPKGGSGNVNEEPWGRIFWCVAIEVVDDEES